MESFKNAKQKEISSEEITIKKKNHDLRQIDVIDVSSGSDEDIILVKEETKQKKKARNKSKKTRSKKNDLFSTSSESELTDDDINLNFQTFEEDGNVSDVNTGIKVKWKKVTSPKTWTEKMRKYYNKPCNEHKYFDWKNILKKIRRENTDHSVQWIISMSDVDPISERVKRCLICRQADHLANKCPKKHGNCGICGVPGHSYYRCPMSMCLNCGIRRNDYVDYCGNCDHWRKVKCNSCKRYGHETKNCTDQWRRFHSTIDNQPINSSGSTLNMNLQCCNCAQPGHLYEDCNEPYFTACMPNSSVVGNYGDFNEKINFRSNNDKTYTPIRNKRSHFNCVIDSEDEIIARKFMKIGRKWEHSDRQRSPFSNFFRMPNQIHSLRSPRLPKVKKGKKKMKKKRRKSSLE